MTFPPSTWVKFGRRLTLEEKQPVTPMMALRLGKLCGNGPDLWLNLQKRYDLQRAAQELGEKIKAIPTLEVA